MKMDDWNKEISGQPAGQSPGCGDPKGHPLVILTGPTAVGKTDLSVELARRIGGEIISADSMQIYRYMDIGSAKVTEEEMRGVRHYLVDALDPSDSFDVVRLQHLAREAAEEIRSHGAIPVVTGGTGFYIQSLLYDIDFEETREHPQIRAAYEKIAAEEGPGRLHQMLADVDPAAAEAIHPSNIKRTVRALEYHALTGKRISEHNAAERAKTSPWHFVYFVLTRNRAELYDRINRRVDRMFDQGDAGNRVQGTSGGIARKVHRRRGQGADQAVQPALCQAPDDVVPAGEGRHMGQPGRQDEERCPDGIDGAAAECGHPRVTEARMPEQEEERGRMDTIGEAMRKQYEAIGISRQVLDYCEKITDGLTDRFREIDRIAEINQMKVLGAMQKNHVAEMHLGTSTGYGYNDEGRETLEKVYADTFHTEAALVRPQITCGTHALATALSANLRPGDELLSPVGKPYDTLEEIIGIRPSKGSLAEYGVTYRQVELLPGDRFDYEGIRAAQEIRKVLRACGYRFFSENPTNQIFIILPDEQYWAISGEAVLGFWEKADETHTVARIATSWATTAEQTEYLCRVLKEHAE